MIILLFKDKLQTKTEIKYKFFSTVLITSLCHSQFILVHAYLHLDLYATDVTI
jgi:hypothetical protein